MTVLRRLMLGIVSSAGYLVLLALVLVAAYVGAGRLAMSQVDRFRGEIEQHLQELSGMQIRIGSLRGGWSAFDPVLQIRDIEIIRNQASPSGSLTLDTIRLQPDVIASVRQQRLVFADVAVGPLASTLSLEDWLYDSAPAADPSADMDWLVELDRLHISRIRFDEVRLKLPEPHVQDTYWLLDNLVVQKTGLAFRLSATVKNARGDIELANLAGFADMSEGVTKASYRAYLKWNNGRFFLPLNTWLDPYGVRLDEALASGELWVEGHSDGLKKLSGSARFSALEWRYELEPQPDIELLQARFVWEPEADGSAIWFPEFSLRARGASLLEGPIGWQQHAGGTHFYWQSLDLGGGRDLLLSMRGMPDTLAEKIGAYAPAGEIRSGRFVRWADSEKYELFASLYGLSASAVDGAPAGSGINGGLFANQDGGEVRFQGAGTAFHFPELYSEGWAFDQAQGRILWELQSGAYRVWGKDIFLLNPDGQKAEITAGFNLWVPEPLTEPNDFELSLNVHKAGAELGALLVPDRLASPEFVDWLKRSVKSGDIASAGYQYAGLIGEAAPEGSAVSQFQLDLRDAHLAYHPEWPHLQDFDALVSLRNSTMQASIPRGRIGQTQLLQPASVRLDSTDSSGTLTIEAKQPIAQADLDYWLNAEPLRTHVGETFNGWKLGGGTAIELQVRVPLDEAPLEADLGFTLKQATLTLPEPDIACRNMNGRVDYLSKDGIRGRLTASCLGQENRVEISTLSWQPGQERIALRANSRGELQRLSETFLEQPVPGWLGGTLDYRFELEIPLSEEQGFIATLSSDLEGVRIDVPRPFGKFEGEASRAVIQARWLTEAENSLVRLDWPGRLFAKGRLEKGVLQRAVISFAAPPVSEPDDRGIWFEGRLPFFDVPSWQSFRDQYFPAEDSGSQGLAVPEWFAGALVEVGEISMEDFRVRDARFGVSPNAESLQILLSAPDLVSGQVILPYDQSKVPDVSLDQLILPRFEDEEGEAGESQLRPDDIPEMKIAIRDLQMGGKRLGAWSWQSKVVGQELTLEDLKGQMPGGTITGRLRWNRDPLSGAQSSILTGKISGSGFHDFYESWTTNRAALTSKSFEVDTGVFWSGTPMDFDWANLSGRMAFKMEKGTFRETGPSTDLFKIFGVLNTDALTRRLALDFSDLYERGLAYDQVEGRASIQEGVVRFESPLAIQAPSSAFKITGTANLATDDIDMRMVVVLPVTKNLPLAALLVGAPQVGGALFLIDKLLGDPLSRLTSATYTIKGTMSEPEIKLEQIFENNQPEQPAGGSP